MTPQQIGFFTIDDKGARLRHHNFELAAFALYRGFRGAARLIEVERVIVAGQLATRERDCTTRAIDFLSTYEAHA